MFGIEFRCGAARARGKSASLAAAVDRVVAHKGAPNGSRGAGRDARAIKT